MIDDREAGASEPETPITQRRRPGQGTITRSFRIPAMPENGSLSRNVFSTGSGPNLSSINPPEFWWWDFTGEGDNAHVSDQFAFQFTDYFHVIGITRRGFLPSSQPEKGYDVDTRARDDIAVLDALGVSKATFVRHSLAGSELSKIGELYNRVDKLVYLDAADLAERFFPPRPEPPSDESLFTSATFKSLWTYQAATARFDALRKTGRSGLHRCAVYANGALTGPTTPDWVSTKLLEGIAGSVNPP